MPLFTAIDLTSCKYSTQPASPYLGYWAITCLQFTLVIFLFISICLSLSLFYFVYCDIVYLSVLSAVKANKRVHRDQWLKCGGSEGLSPPASTSLLLKSERSLPNADRFRQ